ncbi:hypothetical protein [Rhodoferax sp.]|uniref:hypothetical protein n=1 Tax=Rhodoferax sp. TaxID=50421 RepID=UPI0025D45A92|nr:hypothetical protein [Rhodoferax sp.]
MNDALQALLTHSGADLACDFRRLWAYLLAALVCAYIGRSARMAQRTLQMIWLQVGGLYLLAAASALLQGDVLWLRWARAFARAHGAYGERRLLQFAVLLALLLLLAAGWRWLQQVNGHSLPQTLLLAGASGTLGVHLMRYVSFHYTDIAFNAVWLDHSLGSWMELASLGLVATATGLGLLSNQSPIQPAASDRDH